MPQTADCQEFQGSRVANIAERPGLYAWYYRPAYVNRDLIVETLTRFFAPECSITTTVRQRYGMQLVSKATGEIFIGVDDQPIKEALYSAFTKAEPFMNLFFRCQQFVQFSRPVYIGIAENLYERVYGQHFLSLTDYWDDASQVSRYLAANSRASVQNVMDGLELPHSFALEARVCGICSTDLMVSVLFTDNVPTTGECGTSLSEPRTKRSLERFLQLLSDPICGRR